MKYLQYQSCDMVNGEGLRATVWVSYCSHGCKGCFNESVWSGGGQPFNKEAKERLFKDLAKPYISGVTWSGGDPLHKRNFDTILVLSKEIKEKFPSKTVWLYTGYTLDQIQSSYKLSKILPFIDVLVDGKYDNSLPSVQWRGSNNQCVYDIPSSREKGIPVKFIE